MNSRRSLRGACALVTMLAVVATACGKGDETAVKGRNGPNGPARDSVSDLSLSEDGLGQIQIGMNLDDAVNVGLLNENPTMKPTCDFVFPAVGAGIPDGVSVMVVQGKVARIDIDTGSVTTEDGAKIGDTEDAIRTMYDGDVQIEPHKFISGGHYMVVAGDSTSLGKAIVFETDGQRVTSFRAGRLPEVKWVEGCT
jgi:hypothetical protein